MSQALIGIYRVVEMAVGIVNLVFLDRWLVRTGYRRILLWASLGLLVLYPIWLLTPGIWQRLVLSLPISFLFTVYWPIGKAQSLASVPGRGGTITAVQSLIGLVPLPLFLGFYLPFCYIDDTSSPVALGSDHRKYMPRISHV